MLKLSAKTVYGVSAIFELALRYGQEPTRVKDISQKHNIPRNYLDQILIELKKAEIVASHRGARGGYTLEKTPEEITVWDVVQILEGEVDLTAAAKVENPILKNYWKDTDDEFTGCFDTSFRELLSCWQRHQGTFNYSI